MSDSRPGRGGRDVTGGDPWQEGGKDPDIPPPEEGPRSIAGGPQPPAPKPREVMVTGTTPVLSG
jgi:hypothetical protein